MSLEPKLSLDENDRLARFFELSSDLLCIVAFDGYFIKLNPAWQKVLGHELDELTARPFIEFVHADDREATLQELRYTSEGKQSVRFETRFFCKRGGYRWLSWNGVPFQQDGLMLAVARDVTEARSMAEQLRESQRRYSDLFENASDLIQSVDPHGRFLYVNRAWRESLGYTEADVAKLNMQDVIAPEILKHCMELFARVTSGEKVDAVETTFLKKTGERVHVEGSVSCRFEDGRPIATRGIFRDITDRKEIDRLKDEFVSSVSHELRTPLTSIRGSLGLLAGGACGELPHKARPLVDIAINNCHRLIRIVNDILDVEKIEAGIMEFDMRAVELRPQLELAIEANRAYGDQFEVEFVLEEPVPRLQVQLDPDRLQQVMTNLLSNAAKFSPPGSAVTIRSSELDGRVRVEVEDKGPGVPAEFRDRVFHRFAQADSSDTRLQGGSGLGLSISKAIIDRFAGEIGFESAVGRGARFHFMIPTLATGDQPPAPVAKPTPQNAAGPARLLLCVADRPVASSLGRLLAFHGFHVDVVHDSAAVKRSLKQKQYELLAFDPRMSDTDGFTLLRELKSREETQSLPTVLLAASLPQGRMELRGDAVPLAQWLQKPPEPEVLKRVLESLGPAEPGHSIRILHVEDDPEAQTAVTDILGEGFQVTGAADIQDSILALGEKEFDVILLDLGKPGGIGLELLPHVRELSGRSIPLLVLSGQTVGHETADRVSTALLRSHAEEREIVQVIGACLSDRP